MIKILQAKTKTGIEKYLSQVAGQIVKILSLRDDGTHWVAVVVLK